MNIAIVNECVPYPPNSGSRIRTLNLLLRLAARHNITYICRGALDEVEANNAADYLKSNGITMVNVEGVLPRKSGARFIAGLMSNIISPLPYAIELHRSSKVGEEMRRHASEINVDLWQFECLGYADMFSEHPAPRIMMAHNVESLIWRRYCEAEKNVFKRKYLNLQKTKYERFERKVFANVSHLVTVSENDARIAKDEFGASRVTTIDNGIDREYFSKANGRRDPFQILFLGSLDWRPNLGAIDLLLREIFPKILSSIPQARLCIVGRKPPESLIRRIAKTPGVEFHQDVADVRPFLASSGVMAVPLTVGGGSRLKILEALACGLPVVSTTVGAEGLKLINGSEIIIKDSPDQLAESLIWSINNPSETSKMGENGRRKVWDMYDWSEIANRLEDVWVGLANVSDQ